MEGVLARWVNALNRAIQFGAGFLLVMVLVNYHITMRPYCTDDV